MRDKQYLDFFIDKHGYELTGSYDNDVYEFDKSYFIHIDDIKYDIDNNIEINTIFEWQDFLIERYFEGFPGIFENVVLDNFYITYPNYVDGQK